MTPGLHQITSCICIQSTSCDCNDDIMYMYTGFYMCCPRHDNSLYMPSYLSFGTTASPQSHQKVYKTAEARHYQKYIHLADVTKQGDAIMNALNVRKLNVYENSRNQDFSQIGLGMRLPLAMTFHFKVAIPYSWKYQQSLNLAVWPQTRCRKMLIFGGAIPAAYYTRGDHNVGRALWWSIGEQLHLLSE